MQDIGQAPDKGLETDLIFLEFKKLSTHCVKETKMLWQDNLPYNLWHQKVYLP